MVEDTNGAQVVEVAEAAAASQAESALDESRSLHTSIHEDEEVAPKFVPMGNKDGALILMRKATLPASRMARIKEADKD